MVTESEKIKDFISEENRKQARSVFSIEQVMHLTSLSTKSKIITFWLSLAITGGGYMYLNLYTKGFVLFLTCFALFFLGIVCLCNEASEIGVLLCLLSICVHFFSIPFALANVDSIKNKAKCQLSEYYNQK